MCDMDIGDNTDYDNAFVNACNGLDVSPYGSDGAYGGLGVILPCACDCDQNAPGFGPPTPSVIGPSTPSGISPFDVADYSVDNGACAIDGFYRGPGFDDIDGIGLKPYGFGFACIDDGSDFGADGADGTDVPIGDDLDLADCPYAGDVNSLMHAISALRAAYALTPFDLAHLHDLSGQLSACVGANCAWMIFQAHGLGAAAADGRLPDAAATHAFNDLVHHAFTLIQKD